MKKIFLVILLLFSSLAFSQVKTTTVNTKLKLKETPNLSTVDSLLTKDANQVLRSTAFTDFQTQLGLSDYLKNLIEDLTPQLGGNLDLNGFNITGTGNINTTGTITSSGNITGNDLISNNNLSVTGNVLFSNYPNSRIDATALNFLHTDASGNLLSSPISSIVSAPSETVQVSAVWTSGLSFDVTADNFPVNSVFYSATAGTVVLDAADVTNDRIDLIVAEAPIPPATVGTVGKITGTPAANPAEPDYDPSLVYPIKFVLVKAGATTPDGFSDELVYDENVGPPTEWTATSTANIVTNSTNDAFSGTISVEATNPTISDKTTFTNGTTQNTDDLSSLSFYLKLKEVMNNSFIFVKFFNGSSQVGFTYLFRNGQNGFNSTNTSTWQKITIDAGTMNLPSSQYTSIQIYPFKTFDGYFIDLVTLQDGSTNVPPTFVGIPEAPDDGKLYGRKNKQWSEVVIPSKTIETTLPGGGIVIDGTKDYHIETGVIKPAIPTAGHIEGKDVEIISNPTDGVSLSIDLTDYPHVQLQGGGFTESPSNIYTLETDLFDGLLRQHMTLMSWRRNNLFISNSINFIPESDFYFLSNVNVDNNYVDISFNKVIQQSDLVIGNFSKIFTQNGDTATDVTLDSITDSNGDPISGDEQDVRIYFTVTGTSTGLAYFTITAASLSDFYGNTELNVVSGNINLLVSSIEDFANVIAYWKEGQGDNNTVSPYTKTDIKNSKVLSASGEGNPSLSVTEWIFDGVNDGFRLIDTDINNLINADAKDFQVHFVGQYNANSTRIIASTEVGVLTSNTWNYILNLDSTQGLNISMVDDNGDAIAQNISTGNFMNKKLLISMKFYQSSGNKLDVYVDDGTTITSILNVDLSTINVSTVTEFFVGMRETTSKNFYEVNFRSLVFGNSSANFDEIKTKLKTTL